MEEKFEQQLLEQQISGVALGGKLAELLSGHTIMESYYALARAYHGLEYSFIVECKKDGTPIDQLSEFLHTKRKNFFNCVDQIHVARIQDDELETKVRP